MTTKLEVRKLEPHEFESWDRFVELSPQGTVYHSSAWAQAISQAYAPSRPVIWGCFEGKMLVGGCVVLEREKFGLSTAVTPLLTPYAGFVLDLSQSEKFSDRASHAHMILTALGSLLGDNYAYVNLALAPHVEDIRPLQQLGFLISPRFTYYLNMRLLPEEHWNRFDGSARRLIRKAEKEPFELSARLPTEPAYRLFEETFRRRGEECPVSRELFEAILEHRALTPYRSIIAAWHEDQLAGYVVLLAFGQTLYYAIAAHAAEYLPLGVSSLLVWEIIRQYAGQQWLTFDFIGANIPTIARFKENFNPHLQLYFQVERYGLAALKIGKDLLSLIRG